MDLIPTIDIAPLFGEDMQAKLLVGQQIDKVCRHTGFFQITNHGVKGLDVLSNKAFEFFEKLSKEQKLAMSPKKFNPNNNHIYRGYFPASVNGISLSNLLIQILF